MFHMPPGLGRFVLYARITSDCVTAPPSSCEKANPSAKQYKYYLLYTKQQAEQNVSKLYSHNSQCSQSMMFLQSLLIQQGHNQIKVNMKMNHRHPNAC